MPTKSSRMNKIDEELRKEIGSIISLELKNPHLTGLISVTKVKTTPDLRFAKVYVSMINEKSKKQNLAILKQSSGIHPRDAVVDGSAKQSCDAPS